jgi:hypothetical protein
MSWPVGVETRSINFSAGISTEDGTVYEARAIVRTNNLVIHLPTGDPLIPVAHIFTEDFELPVTDQTMIYGDGFGTVYDTSNGGHAFAYHVDIEYSVNDTWVTGRTLSNLVVPDSETPVDLDTVIETGFVSTPIRVLIPDHWSQQLGSGTPSGEPDYEALKLLGLYFPENPEYAGGAQGYPNNDVPAWNACQDDAVLAGGIVIASNQYGGGDGTAYHRGGVTVRGMGNPRVESPDSEIEIGFKANHANFKYSHGLYTSPDGFSRDNNPGPLENFYIDGDFISDHGGLDDGMVRCESAQAAWYNVSVRRPKGNGLCYPSTQNMVHFNVQVGEAWEEDTAAVILTTVTNSGVAGQGVGGCKWYGGHWGDSRKILLTTSSVVGIILPHHDNIIDGVLFETGRTAGKEVDCGVHLDCGGIRTVKCVYTYGQQLTALNEDCNVLIDNTRNNGYSTIFEADGCWFGGGGHATIYAHDNIRVLQSGAYNEVQIHGGTQIANSDYFINVDGSHLGAADIIGSISGFVRLLTGGSAGAELGMFRGTNGGTYAGLLGYRYTPERRVMGTGLGTPDQWRRVGDVGNRRTTDRDGFDRFYKDGDGVTLVGGYGVLSDGQDFITALGFHAFNNGQGRIAGATVLAADAALAIDVNTYSAYVAQFTANGADITSLTLTNPRAYAELDLYIYGTGTNVIIYTTAINWRTAAVQPENGILKQVKLKYMSGQWWAWEVDKTVAGGLTQEQVEDYVGALIQDSATLDVTYNDVGNAVTIEVITEALQDAIAALFADSTTVDVIYNDAGNFITAEVLQAGITEMVQDIIGAFFGDTTSVDVTYNDAGNAISAAVPVEFIQDTIGAFFADTASIDVTYDDAGNAISAAVSTEAIQDIVGGVLTDTGSVDFTYDDAGNAVTAVSSGSGDGWTYERRVTDLVENAGTLTDAFTGFTPAAGVQYEVELHAMVDVNVGTTGAQTGVAAPLAPQMFGFKVETFQSASVLDTALITAPGGFAATTGGVASPTPLQASGDCRWTAPGAGNVKFQFRREPAAGAGTATMYAKSYMRWRALP